MTSALPRRSQPEPSTGLRTGAQYLADIGNDGRQVIYDGEIVRDVTSHPAFSGAARSIAGLWDIAADPANRELMTYPSPKTGKPVLWCYHIPQTAGRPSSSAPHDPALDRAHLRPDGPHARSRRGVLRGLRRLPGFFATAGQRYADNLTASTSMRATTISTSPMRWRRRRSTAASHRMRNPIRRCAPAWSANATEASSSKARSSSRPARRFLRLSVPELHPPAVPGDENHAISVAIPINAPA